MVAIVSLIDFSVLQNNNALVRVLLKKLKKRHQLVWNLFLSLMKVLVWRETIPVAIAKHTVVIAKWIKMKKILSILNWPSSLQYVPSIQSRGCAFKSISISKRVSINCLLHFYSCLLKWIRCNVTTGVTELITRRRWSDSKDKTVYKLGWKHDCACNHFSPLFYPQNWIDMNWQIYCSQVHLNTHFTQCLYLLQDIKQTRSVSTNIILSIKDKLNCVARLMYHLIVICNENSTRKMAKLFRGTTGQHKIISTPNVKYFLIKLVFDLLFWSSFGQTTFRISFLCRQTYVLEMATSCFSLSTGKWAKCVHYRILKT